MLSENDNELLNSSDKEHIEQVTIQIEGKQLERDTASPSKSAIKSSTVNSKHTDLLDQMRQGKVGLIITF